MPHFELQKGAKPTPLFRLKEGVKRKHPVPLSLAPVDIKPTPGLLAHEGSILKSLHQFLEGAKPTPV